MAEVYWVHLPEHNDVFSQGYVGVTRNTAQERFSQHVNDSTRADRQHYHFYRAIRKYQSSLVVSTIIIGEEDYCYLMENRLRPENYIGWNMAAGGQRPVRNPESFGDAWKEKLRQCNLGKEHSQETLDKLSDLSKSNWEREEYLQRMREINLSNRVSLKPLERFWNYGPKRNHLISRADEIFVEYEKDNLSFSREIVSAIGEYVTDANVQFVTKLIRKFNGGWSPLNDPLWLEDFKGIKAPSFYKFSASWNQKGRGDSSHWKYADLAYEMYTSGKTYQEVGVHFNRHSSSFYNMFKYFKDGWIPNQDPRWVSWVEEIRSANAA